MYPLAIPFKLIGQSGQSSGVTENKIELPGWPVHQVSRRGQLVEGRQPIHGGALRPEPSQRLDPGVEGPTTPGSPAVACLEDFKKLRGNLGGHFPGILPTAELALVVVTAEDRGEAVDFAQNPLLSPVRGLGTVGTHSEFERRAHNIFVIKHELVVANGLSGVAATNQGTEYPNRRT